MACKNGCEQVDEPVAWSDAHIVGWVLPASVVRRPTPRLGERRGERDQLRYGLRARKPTAKGHVNAQDWSLPGVR